MLSPNPSHLGDLLMLCPVSGIHQQQFLKSNHFSHHQQVSAEQITNQQSGDHSLDTSCPYSVSNSSFIYVANQQAAIQKIRVQPKRFTHYRSQYRLRLHPTKLPRGPPLAI
ncbi:hypothetical protein [Leucothrix arctica]|uniref:Uncharacterized protein n=1 Tax=Leucothrix arctica TaxID=1481894 RepID=A0A317CL50_9GAMM|nr:hypothetical protein [Leucothrix arctica]PWQ99236.1 hypothetical protein DKT75_01435 [Leucothrix arctica]